MDVDILKYATDDQMDMMLIMQMDKLPEFPDCDSFSASSEQELPTMEFSGGNAAIFTGNCDTPPEASPALLKLPPPISFPNHVQDRSCSPAARFSDAMAGKLRNPADGSCGTTALSKRSSMETMREMIFRIAAMQPIHIDPESVKPPKRRNVKISKDPQSVAARHRRERISERIRILQRLVPGGTKMDTASMLDEAVQYVKFLKTQVQSLERAATTRTTSTTSVAATAAGRSGFPAASHVNYASFLKSYQSTQIFGPTQLLS